MAQASELEYLFHPTSIALVGISSDPDNMVHRMFLQAITGGGFRGKIFLVNPRVSHIEGMRTYPTLRDIPESVDYVFCLVPAPLTPQIVEDCVATGVKFITIFSAGFSEHSEVGAALETQLVKIARRGKLRVIGPNCQGIFHPKIGLLLGDEYPREPGSVAFLSQSGGNTRDLAYIGKSIGLRFSKVISYGNACDLNECDFLEYLSQDNETRVITVYIEGVREGKRFFKVLEETARKKPVILLKGGNTEAGKRAVFSHTGYLSVAEVIWRALCDQTGVVLTENLEELADVALAFVLLPPFSGHRVAVLSTGGGASVQAADECEKAGLSVFPFSPETHHRLQGFLSEVGNNLKNPVDAQEMLQPRVLARLIYTLASCPEVDILLPFLRVNIILRFPGKKQNLEQLVQALLTAGKTSPKPVVVALRSDESLECHQAVVEIREKCLHYGFPVYPSIYRAARALSKFVHYHQNGTTAERRS
jgi:acyl-CoA synthetase (NDP forming)